MAFEHYIRSGSRRLRCGYTTGTCAALAALGAAKLLLTGRAPAAVTVVTPRGLAVSVEPEVCWMDGEAAYCALRKDAGDDKDVTDGALVGARVERSSMPGISSDGGAGVGRVTKPGLDQPVGAAAINRIPRQMIVEAVLSTCDETGYDGGLAVTITVENGEVLAAKTFNPQLGIVGGISILGTSGQTVKVYSEIPISGELPERVALSSRPGAQVEVTVRPQGEALHIIPPAGVLGIGCKRSVLPEALEAALTASGIDHQAICGVCSIDIKAQEPGLLAFCKARGWELRTFSAAELAAVSGDFTPSQFVAQVTGVDNVCERAAVLGSGGALYQKPYAGGATERYAGVPAGQSNQRTVPR